MNLWTRGKKLAERMDPIERVKSVLKLLDAPQKQCRFSHPVNVDKELSKSSNGNNPFSFSSFISRMCTYESQNWSSAPKSAICLAKHGFISIEDNKIKCSGCNEVVDVSYLWGKKEIESVSTKSHKDTCKWSFLSTSEEFFQLPVNSNCIENYQLICNGLMSMGEKLPVIKASNLKPNIHIPQDFVNSVLELFGIPCCETSVSAIIMGLCGWEKLSKKTFQCTFCKRTCATWNFFSIEDNEWRIDNLESNSGKNIHESSFEAKPKAEQYCRLSRNGVDSSFNKNVSEQEKKVDVKFRKLSQRSKHDERCTNFVRSPEVTCKLPSSTCTRLMETRNGCGNNVNCNDISPAVNIMTACSTGITSIPICKNNCHASAHIEPPIMRELDNKSGCCLGANFNQTQINKFMKPFEEFEKLLGDPRFAGKSLELNAREATEERMEVLDNETCNLNLYLPTCDNTVQNYLNASEIDTQDGNIYVNNLPQLQGNGLTIVYPPRNKSVYPPGPSIRSVEGDYSVYWVNNKGIHDGHESHDSESSLIELCSDETSTCKDDSDFSDHSSASYVSLSEYLLNNSNSQYKGKYCVYSAFWNAGKSKEKALRIIRLRDMSVKVSSPIGMTHNSNLYNDERNLIFVSEGEMSYECNDELDNSRRKNKKKSRYLPDQKHVTMLETNKGAIKLNGQQITHFTSNSQAGSDMIHKASDIYNNDLNTGTKVLNKCIPDLTKCDNLSDSNDAEKLEDSGIWHNSMHESVNNSNKFTDRKATKVTDRYQRNDNFNKTSLEGILPVESVEKQGIANNKSIEFGGNKLVDQSKFKKYDTESCSSHYQRSSEINQRKRNSTGEKNNTSHPRNSSVENNEHNVGCLPSLGSHSDSETCEVYGVAKTILKYSKLEDPLNDSMMNDTFMLDFGKVTKFSNSPSKKIKNNSAHSVPYANRHSLIIPQDSPVIQEKNNKATEAEGNSKATEAEPLPVTGKVKRKREEMDDSDDSNKILKAMKMEREKFFFHPVLEHHFWCMWRINKSYTNEITLPKKGWEEFLDIVYEKLKKEETERKLNEFSQVLNCISTICNL